MRALWWTVGSRFKSRERLSLPNIRSGSNTGADHRCGGWIGSGRFVGSLEGVERLCLGTSACACCCRAANLLVKHHGQDAPIPAAMRADAMLEKDDVDSYAVWKRILKAVEELQGTMPKPGEAVHCVAVRRNAVLRRERIVLYCSGSVVNMSGYPSLRPASVPSLALLSATSRVYTATTQAPRECAVIMTR